MPNLHSIASLAGKALRAVRAGDKKLGSRQAGMPATRSIAVTSSAFTDGAPIPDRHAGEDGASPALAWSNLPDATKEIVVLCEDPDAPFPKPFVHWLAYGIAPSASSLAEGVPKEETPAGLGLRQGLNTTKRSGYTGPKPPPGHGTHHYHFQVFALREPSGLGVRDDRDAALRAMEGKVLAIGEIVGTFERA